MAKKFFLIACEASADLHGYHLIQELSHIDSKNHFRGLGGPKMKSAGMEVIQDMTKMSALGFGDVIRQYPIYKQHFDHAIEDVKQNRPDAIILIDSPAFNLRFAKKIRKTFKDLPIFYFICPQIWAWGHQRIRVVKENITKLFSIFPFEVAFYQGAGIDCEFVGHPLMEHPTKAPQDREEMRKELQVPERASAVGILPGSRTKEVERILPTMLESAKLLQEQQPKVSFYLARSETVRNEVYDEILKKYALEVTSFTRSFEEQIIAMDFALVTSGTATLQTALANVPFFLLYKTSWSTYWLGKFLIKVPYLGIVNLLAQKLVIPEFIQRDAKPKTIAHEARVLLNSTNLYQHMQHEFLKIRESLGRKPASKSTAQSMMSFLENSQEVPRGIPV